MSNHQQFKDHIYTLIISNIGGFSTIHFLKIDFNFLDWVVKLFFGLIAAGLFAIAGELTKLWLSKQPFYKRLKKSNDEKLSHRGGKEV